jgi:dsRNA-specific ribonuclease
MFNEEKVVEKIHGIRGEKFKKFITDLLLISGVKSKYVDKMITDENISLYENGFTNKDYDVVNNYEFMELLGDVTCNKIIVWYLKKRFPILNNTDGVKVMARLRINLVSGKHFAAIAKKLGFLPYISYTNETMNEKQLNSILEDVFEAFIGITETIIDKEYDGLGYKVCYHIFEKILDEEYISLSYKDLYDPITRLKETFDYYNSESLKGSCSYIWGNMKWVVTKTDEGQHHVRFCQKNSTTKEEKIITEGFGQYLDETKNKICESYLTFLKSKGY